VGDAPPTAEVAIAVLDEWQGRGVGRALLHRLAAVARRRGILRFTGMMLADNTAIISLMRSLGRVVSTHRESGTVELVVEIDSDSVS
jgi:GNAT superfamily N-acetyltransferase